MNEEFLYADGRPVVTLELLRQAQLFYSQSPTGRYAEIICLLLEEKISEVVNRKVYWE